MQPERGARRPRDAMDSRCRVRAKPRDAEPWFERRCEEHSWLDMEERTAPAPRYKRRGGRTSVFIGRRPALAALVLLCLPAAAQRGRCPAGPAAGAEELAAVARGLAEGGQLRLRSKLGGTGPYRDVTRCNEM